MKRWLAVFLLAGLTGCDGSKHVTGPEFQREYELRNTQTMVASEYLGERDGQVFLKRRTMSLVNKARWEEEIWCTETNNLAPAFLSQLRTPRTAGVTVILFDSADATHPSPRDSRWAMTNAVHAAALARHLQSARVIPPNGPPPPACAVVACVEMPATGGTTNRTFIHHVHFPTSVLLSRDDKRLALTNGAGFLADLAQAGFPTNRLAAANKP